MNGLLIGVLVFLAFMIVVGAMRGLVKMVLSVAVVILAGVMVWLAAPYAKELLIEKTDFEVQLAESTTEKLESLIDTDAEFLTRLESLPLTENSKKVLLNSKASLHQKIAELGEYIADRILTAAIYLLLFLVFYLILRLIAFLIEKLADSDGLKFINRALGSLLALIEGILILDVAALALILFANTGWGMKAYQMISESEILTFLNDYNLLLIIMNHRSAV